MFNELVLNVDVFSKLVASRVGVLHCLIKLADQCSTKSQSVNARELVCTTVVRELLVIWGLRFSEDPKEIEDYDTSKLINELSNRFQGSAASASKVSETQGSNLFVDANIRDSVQLMTAKLIGVIFFRFDYTRCV